VRSCSAVQPYRGTTRMMSISQVSSTPAFTQSGLTSCRWVNY